MDNLHTKEELIDQIKQLIDTESQTDTVINIKYIEYFELDELIEIRDLLQGKKDNSHQDSNDFLDEIFNKCS